MGTPEGVVGNSGPFGGFFGLCAGNRPRNVTEGDDYPPEGLFGLCAGQNRNRSSFGRDGRSLFQRDSFPIDDDRESKEGRPQLLDGVGRMLQKRGKLSEAEPVMREALQARREAFGDKDPSTLDSMGHLGALLNDERLVGFAGGPLGHAVKSA